MQEETNDGGDALAADGGMARRCTGSKKGGGASTMYGNEGRMMCGGPGYDYYVWAGVIRSCGTKLEASTDRIRSVQSIDWQSPAGEAFRQCMYEDLRNVMNLRDEVANVAAVVERLADAAALEETVRTAGAAG